MEASGDLSGHALSSAVVAVRQVGANESVLASEQRVEGRLGHPGPLDDPIHADRVHALLVEQVAGGGQQALTSRDAFDG